MRNEEKGTLAALPNAEGSEQASLFDIPSIRLELVREGEISRRVVVQGNAHLFELLGGEIATWERERFITVHLDSKHAITGVEQVSVGSLTGSLVHPAEVFKGLVLANAAGFVCIHNHISGDLSPSAEDIALTRRLQACGELFGIRLLDHLIFGRDHFVALVAGGYCS